MVEFKVNGRNHTFDDIIRRAKDSGKFHFRVSTNDPDKIVRCFPFGGTEWSITIPMEDATDIVVGNLASIMAIILKWNPKYFLFPEKSNVEITGWNIQTLVDEEFENRVHKMKEVFDEFHEHMETHNVRDSIKRPLINSHEAYFDMLKEYKKYRRLNK